MDGIEWGDVATWSSSGVALVALMFAGSAWRREASRDRRLAQDRESLQANLVAAWEKSREGDMISVQIRNASTLPVYNAHVTTLGWEENGWDRDMKSAGVEVLGPGDDAVVELEWGELLTLEFTDAAQARWRRTDESLVKEVDRDRGIRADLRAILLIPERRWRKRVRPPLWRRVLSRQAGLARRRQRRIDNSRLARWMHRGDPWY